MSNQNRIHLEVSRAPGVKLFRNNVGQGWVGKFVQMLKGCAVIANPRRTAFGLAVGSADLIGWRKLEITEDMVGRTVAVFLSVECKAGSDYMKDEQSRWMWAVRGAGGIAVEGRDPIAAAAEVSQWRP